MEPSVNIMVVDDERHICENVAKILSKNNYRVELAMSAEQALEKMAKQSFELLISDIVMPGTNGLELLKTVKRQWPQTKAIMMTAYAATNTAVKAVRLGALDYVPKPFTPKELRSTVDSVLHGRLTEAAIPQNERDAINIDVDIPFDVREVASAAGDRYAKMLGPSDMPVVEVKPIEASPDYCQVGDMICDIFAKLGATCKAGTKTAECPQKKARQKAASEGVKPFDHEKLIGIDQPFDYDEVVSVTGPEYVHHLDRDGFAFLPYEQLKLRIAASTSERQAEMTHVVADSTDRSILVIDDEVAVNNNIRKILTRKGFLVDQALTKAEALARIAARSYRLVLLDLRIPGVEGLELLRAVRTQRPETRVIIITGYASIETAVETTRLGAVDYLAKPFTPDEVRSAAENALRLAA